MNDEHWKFVIDNERQLRGLCRVMSRGRSDQADELYCDVVVGRCEAIYNTYNPDHIDGASLKHHMIINMRWYMYKHMNALMYRESRTSESLSIAMDTHGKDSVDLETTEWVSTILNRLDEHDRWILLLYHKEELTQLEIANLLGSDCKGTGRHHYERALRRARIIANGMASER